MQPLRHHHHRSSCNPPQSVRPRGISAIEVLVAIAIVALLAAAVLLPVGGALDRADMAARAAEAARLNAALERLAAEGRLPPPEADAVGIAQFLRALPAEAWNQHAASTGAAIDPGWRPRLHTAVDRRPRLVWTGTAFVPTRVGSGLRPAGRGEAGLPDAPPAPAVPEGTGFAADGPWLWDAINDPGPHADPATPRDQPHLRLRHGLTPINGPITITQPGNLLLVLDADPPGDLTLQLGDITRQGTGSVLALVHPFASGEERDLMVIGERHDPDPAARGRLAFPVLVRLTPSCTLTLLPPPAPVDVPEDGTALATLAWEARWSDGPVESGTLNLPLNWNAPGGTEESVPVTHRHAGRSAGATVIARHAPATAPLQWTAYAVRGSLPWTGIRWQLQSLDGGTDPPPTTTPIADPPGALPGAQLFLDFAARLPAGSWRLTASLLDSAGTAAASAVQIEVHP